MSVAAIGAVDYAQALEGLSLKQAQLMLTTQGIVGEEQRQILIRQGLIATSDNISAKLTYQALQTTALTKAEQQEMLIEMGLMDKKSKQLLLTNSCTEAELRAQLTKRGYIGTQQDEIVTAILGTGVREKEAISWKVLTASILESAKAMLVWLATNPVGQMIIAAGVVAGVAGAYDLLTMSVEEAQESLEEFNQACSDLDSATTELQSIDENIKSIQDKGTLSLTDQADLSRLEQEKSLLEKEIQLLERKKELASEKSNSDAVKAVNDGTYKNGDGFFSRSVDDLTKAIMQGELDSSSSQEYLRKRGKKTINDAQIELAELQERNMKLLGQITGTDEESEKAKKELQDYIDYINQYLYTAEELQKMKFDGFLSENESIKNAFNDLSKNGADVTSDSIEELANKFPALKTYMDENGISAETLAAEFAKTSNETEIAGKNLDKMTVSLETFNKEMDAIQSSYDAVKSAIDEYNEQGYLSVDTTQKLLELDDELLATMVDENGQVNLNTASFEDLARAKLENLKASATEALTSWIDKLKEEGVNAESLAKKYEKVALAKNLVNGEVPTGFIDNHGEWVDVTNTPEYKAYLARTKAIDDAIAGIGKGGLGSSGDKNKKDLAKEHLEKARDYAEKVSDIQEDLAEKEKKFAEDMAEAWKEEHLAQLKDDLEKRADIINRYKKDVEIDDFGLDFIEEDDFLNKSDLLTSKLSNLTAYGKAMREEFDRVANIIPQTGDEAQELASRLEELGSEMRDNASNIRETTVELQKLAIEMATMVVDTHFGKLQREMDNIDRRINILKSDYREDFSHVTEIMNLDALLPVYSDFDKERREKQRADQKLIDLEQETQDKINDIVTKALEQQSRDNAAARAKERQNLSDDMEKARQDAQKKLAEAHQDYLNFLEDNKIETSKAVQEITDMFADAEISLPEVDISSVDDAIGKVKEKLDSTFNLTSSGSGNDYIKKALQYDGLSYIYGSKDPKNGGLDCSGLTSLVYGISGNAKSQAKTGTAVEKKDIKPGDQIILQSSGSPSGFHTGIYVGDNRMFAAIGKSKGIGYQSVNWDNVYAIRRHAMGTPSGNAKSKYLGIAGENYRPEVLIDKATGETTLIDSPTVIDTTKTDVIGEKQTANLPKFEDGTVDETVDWIETFYTKAVDAISNIQKDYVVQALAIENDSLLSNFDKSQKLYELLYDNGKKASETGAGIYNDLFNAFQNWISEVEKDPTKWSVEIYNAFKDTLGNISDKTYEIANNAVASKQESAEDRWNNSQNWISDRKFYNDWGKYGDSEIDAWKRVLVWLRKDFPEEMDKIKEAERNLFEARRKEFDKANNFAGIYLNSQKSLLQAHFDVENSIAEARHEINKELETSMTMYGYLEEETRQLLFNQEDHNKLSKELNEIEDEALRLKSEYEYKLYNSTLETVESITSEYQIQYETLMKSYEIAKADLEIAKKKQKLNNVLNERNVRMFINGQWQWVADTEDVINAKSELADAEYAKRVEEAGLTQQKSIDNLTRSQDELNVAIKKFENGVIDLESAVTLAKYAIGSMPDALSSIYGKAYSNNISYGGTYSSSGRVLQVGSDGNAPAGATIGDIIQTAGGNYKIVAAGTDGAEYNHASGHYSIKVGTVSSGLSGSSSNRNAVSANKNGINISTVYLKQKNARGTGYTQSGSMLAGEDGAEIFIDKNGHLIPVLQPTIFKDIGAGGKVFNGVQMQNLKSLWDLSNVGFNHSLPAMVERNQSASTIDNSIHINGITVSEQGNEDWINGLRRFAYTHGGRM